MNTNKNRYTQEIEIVQKKEIRLATVTCFTLLISTLKLIIIMPVTTAVCGVY